MKYYDPTMETVKMLIVTVDNKPAINDTLPSENESAFEKKRSLAAIRGFKPLKTKNFRG